VTDVEQELRRSKNQWEWKAYQLINDTTIPPGCLVTYGRLAELTNEVHGTSINARNVANLRRKLYGLLGHDTDVPLHRIAKKDDVASEYDSPTTKRVNDQRRSAEGTLSNPRWV
jgi:alkylated DNA nucleotide flippase Atl1